MAEPVIVVDELSKRFESEDILSKVSLTVASGEVLGLIGPNGGGKSTLLLAMAGLIRPTSGTVMVGGIPAHLLATQSSGSVGLITAHAGLYPLLTGRENLRYFGSLYGLSAKQVDKGAQPILERLEVAKHQDRRASEYSSGMLQKMSLARALLLSPRALLLDEPTSNLDPISTQTIHSAVRHQADAGIGVVLCTHNLLAAEFICDRVAVLQQRLLDTADVPPTRRSPDNSRLYQLYVEHVEEA